MKIEGWILDAGVSGDYIELWIKMKSGKTIPLLYSYQPSFYAWPKNSDSSINIITDDDVNEDIFDDSNFSIREAASILENHEHVRKIECCKRFVSVSDAEMKEVIRVWVDSPKNFKKTIKDIDASDKFDLFNIDIPIAQTFFYDTDLFPMGLCEFELNWDLPKNYGYSKNNMIKIKKIKLIDSNEDIFYEFPPLRVVLLALGDFGDFKDTRNPGKSENLENPEKSGSSGTSKHRVLRPKLNDRLISCKITLVEGYNYRKIESQRPPWATERIYSEKYDEQLLITVEKETEADTLLELSEEIKKLDPDIILTEYGDEYTLPYLIARASANNCARDLYLSRDKSPLKNNVLKITGDTHFFSYGALHHRSRYQFYLRGRIHMDVKTYGSLHFSDGNIHGVIEVARVSYVPLQRLTRITIGGALQSIQFYIAKKKGYLVPPEKKNSENFQTATTLLHADRGGHIFEPIIGVFERVGEFDFTSMYPMIMVNYNVSPDTINCQCCGEDGNKVPDLPFHTCKKRTGIIPEALMIPLNKRIAYKKFAKKLPKKQAEIFKNISAALKWILVVSFGYLGFKNARFGRVEGHQAVCAYSRELLLQTQEIAERWGFRVLHGIVDSMWLQHSTYPVGIIPDPEENGRPKLIGVTHYSKKGLDSDVLNTQLGEFNHICRNMADEIRKAINIPIQLDATYKFIVFLPSRQFSDVPVLNHYWGVTYDGEIKVRGIEIRRRDAPKIVKNAQRDIMKILSGAANICEFMEFLPLAKRKLDEYYKRIDSGKVTGDDLAIINRTSKKVEDYKVRSYQAIASTRMRAKGFEVEPGQKVEYIIKDASSSDPNKRIMLLSEFDEENKIYDKEKYKELLKRGFQNIIPFDYEKISQGSAIKGDSSNFLTKNGSFLANDDNGRSKFGLDRFFSANEYEKS